MSQEYFDKWAEIAQKAQLPLQQMMELNLKTLKDLDYIRPDEIMHINSPEKFLEKQMQLGLTNSQKALHYMEKSFKIMTDAMLSNFQKSSTEC